MVDYERLIQNLRKTIIFILIAVVITIIGNVIKNTHKLREASQGNTTINLPDNIIGQPDENEVHSENNSLNNSNYYFIEDSPDNQASVVWLHRINSDSASPFIMENMLPGDAETKNYNIRIYHEESVDLYLGFDNVKAQGQSDLSNVLRVNVKTLHDNKEVYDGTFADLINNPVKLDVKPGSEKYSDIYFSIKAYLGTEVGNEYADTILTGDLKWWVEGDLITPPITADTFDIAVYLVLCILAAVLIISAKYKKGVNNND